MKYIIFMIIMALLWSCQDTQVRVVARRVDVLSIRVDTVHKVVSSLQRLPDDYTIIAKNVAALKGTVNTQTVTTQTQITNLQKQILALQASRKQDSLLLVEFRSHRVRPSPLEFWIGADSVFHVIKK